MYLDTTGPAWLRCSFGNMNTNAQAHTDLIWSFEFDKGAVPVAIVVSVVALVALMVFVRKRKKA